LAYRYLKFTNLSTNVTTANPLNYASPLQNANGGNASIDYSGIEVGLGLRFYLGKGD
jgi:hypothetical protein